MISAVADPFIIYALPRSRTTWLARFLSYGSWTCHHDAAGEVDTLAGLAERLRQPHVGMCETALGFASRALYRLVQHARVLVVRRPREAIRDSIRRQGYVMPDGYYEREERALDMAARIPGAVTVTFDELATPAGAARAFEHCLQQPFDVAWWERRAGQNIQTDFAMSVQLGRNRAPLLAAMRAEAEQVMEMPTVQNESWDRFFADAQPLFLEHRAEAGPSERIGYNPDFDLAARAYKLGFLQITTARTREGVLVGYLLCQIERHLEDRDTLRGIQIPFFVRKSYRGLLPLKMHAHMRESLAARGVKLLTVRSGVRGVGGRQDALFRYLRAKPDGHMYMLPIGDP